MNNVNILPEVERRQGTAVKTKCINSGDAFQKTIGKTESDEKISPLKQLKPAKAPLRQKTKKNGDILFIDLTADEITEKVIKKKKHLKLHWLTEVKKKLNTKTIKAAEKKKKAQIVANNASDDSMLSGLVDSTSTGSLSTATTPEPLICQTGPLLRSLSTATTPEPENCVTSNFVENEEIGEQPTCDVTTTVTESTSTVVSDGSNKESLDVTDGISVKEPESWTVNQLSNALSHVCESYESDNSEGKVEEPAVKTEREVSQSQKDTEIIENVDNCQRSTSDSSEVAVIFTRRGSDVEIVDLDEYTEEVRDTESDEICKVDDVEVEVNFVEDLKNSENTILSGDVKDLTLQTRELKLTNSCEVPNDEKRSSDTNFVDRKKLKEVELNFERNFVQDSVIDCDIENKRNYESSEVGEFEIDDRKEYVDKEKLIPKINEIIISTNEIENNVSSDLINNQEPQFNDNIDGLSLLASVSQHVSHLAQHVSHLEEYSEKSLSKPNKIMNGEVPGANVTASKNKVVPLILETNLDLNCSKIENNLIPVDQVVKDKSTNVIVNGETVVLFQKSPNSNLYIINKAVDNNTMECLSEESNTIERNLTTMRNIINQIPINLSENQEVGKNLRKLSNQFIKKEHANEDYYKDSTGSVAESESLKHHDFVYEDPTTTGRSNKREGTSNENCNKKSIKQEFGSFGDHQQVARLDYPNIYHPVESKNSNVYSGVTTATNFYEHFSFPTCSLKVSSSESYQQPNCAYNVLPDTASLTHLPYVQNSYFLSTESDDRDMKLTEAALAKLKDDQLLHNIERSIMDDKKVEIVPEIKYKPEFDSKLPLKKRLKAHAMLSMNFGNDNKEQVKIERVENYPGTPMMSIAAALESRNVSQIATSPNTSLELSPRVKNEALSSHTTEMIRRDYLKDTSLTSIGNSTNVNIMAVGNQRSFKTPAQRKEAGTMQSPLKRSAPSSTNPKSPKKDKKIKTTSNGRQTRSSKRNIPKVDYSYDGIIDTELKFNSLRKRKRTSR